MTLHFFAGIVGWGAVGIGLWSTWIQFQRIQRQGHEGVSLATWVLFLFMGLFWITYGVTRRSPEIIMGSLIVFPLQIAIVARLEPFRHVRVLGRSFGYFALLCVAPVLIWGWIGGLIGTGIAMTINRGPQIVELIRHADASGVSVASWVWGATGSAMWVFFYFSGRLWGALAATAFAGLANVTIAGLARWRHGQALAARAARERDVALI
ncbi:MAG: hypothetical protein KGL79_05420 [Acidobacteriota bacterium]|nr:hypothetical protein [Acidobacteriota bacterium]